jgi:hypothetical protein
VRGTRQRHRHGWGNEWYVIFLSFGLGSCFPGWDLGLIPGSFYEREKRERESVCVVLRSVCVVAFHLALANSDSSYVAPYPEQKCELQR